MVPIAHCMEFIAASLKTRSTLRLVLRLISQIAFCGRRHVPDHVSEAWAQLKRALLAAGEDWEVWTDWYEDRLVGRSANWRTELARTKIDEEIWRQGPKVVNATIRRIIDDQQGLSTEPAKDEDRLDHPTIPSARHAAVELRWDNHFLTIPKSPARTDQGEAGFASSLLGLRNILRNFADEISGEANIDRRFVSFVRKVADQIPEGVPPQYELFEIGHVEAVFAEYARTVNEQWPNFLAARYHATILQFDRTMRQSEAWRDFKRNAQELKLTDAQARQTAELASAAAATLRNDEAGDFVDPFVPQVLEQLADPRSRWPDDALAEIETGKEELAADLIESTNNIFKAVAEVALPVVTEAAAAARRMAGKTGAAFWQEFEEAPSPKRRRRVSRPVALRCAGCSGLQR